jgi:hypothetical protein
MGCNIKNEVVSAQRDIFKELKESAVFKKAENKLNGILDGSITLEDLQKEQKANGKKRLVTKTARGKDTDTVPIYEHVEVEQVQAKKTGTNFFFRLSPNQWESTIEDDVEVVITKKTYKEIKVTYKVEDTSEKKDMRTEIGDLQKLADNVAKGGQEAIKIFEKKIAEVGETFDGAYNGIHTLLEKVRADANIPIPPSEAVVIVDKEKRHSASNVINLDDPVSITRVRARKANTNFFFNVTQYKFLKESASIITTNSYAEYIVNYRGKGSKTKNNDPTKLPSKDSIMSDLNEGLSALNENIGNVTQAIGEAAGQFGKDLSGLVASASSGSLIQDALAKAQNQPATHTVEKNIRDKNTNAINLPSLAGGEKGILEVQTRREDQQFFSNMNKGNVAGWRLDGEDLYLFEPRAEVKVKYTKEIDPPASAGVPAMSNDPDIPKLNPCLDIPGIKVKFLKEIRKDLGTGETIETVVKTPLVAPVATKTPVIRSEPAPVVAESSSTIDATKSPTSNLRQDDSVNLLDFYRKRADLVTKERKFSTNYLFEKNEMFAPKFKEITNSQEVKSVVSKKKLAEKNGGKKFGSTLEWFLTYPDELTTEERKVYNNMLVLFASIQSFDSWSIHYKTLVMASRMLTTERISQDTFDRIYDVFLNFEGVIMSDDPGVNSDLGPDGLILPITSELDIAVFSNVPVLHEQNKDLLIAMEKYKNEN